MKRARFSMSIPMPMNCVPKSMNVRYNPDTHSLEINGNYMAVHKNLTPSIIDDTQLFERKNGEHPVSGICGEWQLEKNGKPIL